MRYHVDEIEDQIIATLTRDTMTGTITTTGTAVVGTNTLFNTELEVGDEIMSASDEASPQIRTVSVITDSTHLTVSEAFSPNLSGEPYALRYPDGTRFECNTHAGEISSTTFMIPELMEGFVRRIPLILVQYQGRTTGKGDSDSTASIYTHTLIFRLYAGAESLRSGQEAARGAYDLLEIVYDRLHGRIPLMASNQVNPNMPLLEGVPISTSEFNPLSPLMETGGADEKLVVNLPDIKVYQSDFKIKVIA